MRPCVEPAHAPPGNFTKPPVAPVAGHLPARRLRPVRVAGAAGVENAQPGGRGHGPRRGGRSHRILLVAQVPDHANIEKASGRTARQTRVRYRLVNDTHLRKKLRGQRFPDQIVERDQDIGVFERPPGGRFIGVQKAVHIRSGERHDQRTGRKTRSVAGNRCGAPPGMEGDHQVRGSAVPGGLDRDAVAEGPEEPRPADRRDAVPAARTRARRGY